MALITSDRARFPNDPWQLVETVHLPGNAGTLETLFSLGNGHLGIRGGGNGGCVAGLAHGRQPTARPPPRHPISGRV